jgi:hypothetical protein
MTNPTYRLDDGDSRLQRPLFVELGRRRLELDRPSRAGRRPDPT